MEIFIDKLIDGGKYCADFIELYINDQLVGEWYYEGEEDEDEYRYEMFDLLEDNNDEVITIIGYRLLQGKRPTESITIDNDIYVVHDYFMNKTISYRRFSLSSR
jgi:hypothetical protein